MKKCTRQFAFRVAYSVVFNRRSLESVLREQGLDSPNFEETVCTQAIKRGREDNLAGALCGVTKAAYELVKEVNKRDKHFLCLIIETDVRSEKIEAIYASTKRQKELSKQLIKTLFQDKFLSEVERDNYRSVAKIALKGNLTFLYK